MEKRWHRKKWTSHRSGSWSEPKLCGRIEVQMNPGCLFASSDVVCWEGMHLGSCFSTLTLKQSCGSIKSWPSVGEIWIIGGLFHGFLLCEFFHVSLSSFTPSAVFVSKMFFFFFFKPKDFRISERFLTLNTSTNTVLELTVTGFAGLQTVVRAIEWVWTPLKKCEERDRLAD